MHELLTTGEYVVCDSYESAQHPLSSVLALHFRSVTRFAVPEIRRTLLDKARRGLPAKSSRPTTHFTHLASRPHKSCVHPGLYRSRHDQRNLGPADKAVERFLRRSSMMRKPGLQETDFLNSPAKCSRHSKAGPLNFLVTPLCGSLSSIRYARRNL